MFVSMTHETFTCLMVVSVLEGFVVQWCSFDVCYDAKLDTTVKVFKRNGYSLLLYGRFSTSFKFSWRFMFIYLIKINPGNYTQFSVKLELKTEF